MEQHAFVEKVKEILRKDNEVLGVALGGSWITQEIDPYSDVDFVIVTKTKVGGDKERMFSFAERLGDLLSGFTGEHVGEPRLLICLYDNPLLHVDLKFITPDEFRVRIEDPVILLDKEGMLQSMIQETKAVFPSPDYQWIEDRFWIWIHYQLLKIGRGELMESLDGFSFLRGVVLGPLLHMKNRNQPRGVRKVETLLREEDRMALLQTISRYDKPSQLQTLRKVVSLYRELRVSLFGEEIIRQGRTEEKVMSYFDEIERQS